MNGNTDLHRKGFIKALPLAASLARFLVSFGVLAPLPAPDDDVHLNILPVPRQTGDPTLKLSYPKLPPAIFNAGGL